MNKKLLNELGLIITLMYVCMYVCIYSTTSRHAGNDESDVDVT